MNLACNSNNSCSSCGAYGELCCGGSCTNGLSCAGAGLSAKCDCPSAYTWDFQSGTQNWAIASKEGVLTVGTLTVAQGRLSLSFDASNNPENSAAFVFIRVPLCGGRPVDISGRTFSANVRYVTDASSPPLPAGQNNSVTLQSGTNTGLGWDFSVDSQTGTWNIRSADTFGQQYFGAATATHIGFRLGLQVPWKGTISIDDVSVQ